MVFYKFNRMQLNYLTLNNKTMDHPPGHENGLIAVLISFANIIVAWITAAQLQVYISMTASVVAGISGIVAGLYYLEAWKEKKRLNNKPKPKTSSL